MMAGAIVLSAISARLCVANTTLTLFLRSTFSHSRIFSRNAGVYLEAQGSIVDALNHEFTNIQGNTLVLTAGGGIGADGNYLDVDAPGQGTLTATAEGDIHIADTADDLNIRNVLSRHGSGRSLRSGIERRQRRRR